MNIDTEIEYLGVSQSIRDWAIKNELNPSTLLGRISRGWDINKALHKPSNTYNKKAECWEEKV